MACFAELKYAEADNVNRSMAVMQLLARLQGADPALYAGARSVLDWHYRHLFCARCGASTPLSRAGWGRKCARCNSEHFPRVDPVVIMLAEFEGRVLVGRQPMFPPKFYSALAFQQRRLGNESGAKAAELQAKAYGDAIAAVTDKMRVLADAKDRALATPDQTPLQKALLGIGLSY